jgi:hypothetical protein
VKRHCLLAVKPRPSELRYLPAVPEPSLFMAPETEFERRAEPDDLCTATHTRFHKSIRAESAIGSISPMVEHHFMSCWL